MRKFGAAIHDLISGRLLGRFLLWLVPSFLLVSALGIYVVVERDLKQEVAEIVGRVGNHTGRVAAVLERNGVATNPRLGADLMSSLLADSSVRCVKLSDVENPLPFISLPKGLECYQNVGEQELTLAIEGRNPATLSVMLNFGEVTEARRKRRNLAVSVLVLGLFVALAATLVAFRQTITLPLRRLLKGIDITARTGEPSIIVHESKDELGVVIDSYNQLQEKLAVEAQTAQLSLQRIGQLYNATPAPMFCVDEAGVMVEVSAYWLTFTGFSHRDVVGQPVGRYMRVPGSGESAIGLVRACAGQLQKQDCDVCILTHGGAEIDCLLSVSAQTDGPGGYLCVVTDISHLRRAERQLRRAAFTDPLSGLANRAAIPGIAENLMRQAGPADCLSVIYVDFDNFKHINDTFGHDAGDQLISEAVVRIGRCLGDNAHAVRLGGDEFAVFLRDVSGGQRAPAIAHAIIAAMKEPVNVGKGTGTVTISAGIASLDTGKTNWAHAMHCADLAMYQAKQEGKNRCVVYSSQLGNMAAARVMRTGLVRQGLDEGAFSLFFQPIVRLSDRRPVAAESLLRIKRPDVVCGSIQDLIQTAEENGEIERIGGWILGEAMQNSGGVCALVAPERYISVNLSPKQLNARFVPALQQQIERIGIAPGQLVVEITETALVRNFDEAARVLADVRALGVRVALDDFGTGYSSLNYLARLPVDIIKLDRQLTSALEKSLLEPAELSKATALIRAIVSLTSDLGMSVVAEGIECDNAAEAIARLGVQYGQGYLFSRPMPIPLFNEWAAKFDRPASEAPPFAILKCA